MSVRGGVLEVDLGRPFRMTTGQQVCARGTELALRKVGLVRREAAAGLEEQGAEVILTLEARLGEAVKRRSFSWREGDEGDLHATWVLGELVVGFDRHLLFTVTAVEHLQAQGANDPGVTATTSSPPRAPSTTPPEPLATVAQPRDATSEHQGTRVRRKRKRRRRRPLERLLDTVTGALKSLFAPSRRVATTRLSSGRSSRHHRSSSEDDEKLRRAASLTFEQRIGWPWSLTVRAGDRLVGTMRGASPLGLVTLVEDYVVEFGDPRPGFAIHLGNTRTGRALPLDRALLAALRSERAGEVLKSLDSAYPRHSPSQSESVTVMVDDTGRSVNAVEVIATAFDPRGRP